MNPTAAEAATDYKWESRAKEADENFAKRIHPSPLDECDPKFAGVIRELIAMHNAKGHDYGAGEDPYANVRASTEWGVPAWQGCMMRSNDKMHRLKQFAIKGTLKNEGVEDTLIDSAVYAIIALILFREGKDE